MSPIRIQCQGCGKAVQAPETAAGKSVKCASCGKLIQVPPGGPARNEQEGELELNCRDCGKVFNVSLDKMGEVVSCPSCGSWVKAGPRRRSILERDIPLPFQVSSSVLRSLRFFAGVILIVGLTAAIVIGVVFSRTPEERPATSPLADQITLKPKLDQDEEPTGEYVGFIARRDSPAEQGSKVTDPLVVTLAFLLGIAAVVGSIILMALYWILRDVQALALAIRRSPPQEE